MCPTLRPHQPSLTQHERGNVMCHMGKSTVPPETLGRWGTAGEALPLDWCPQAHTPVHTHHHIPEAAPCRVPAQLWYSCPSYSKGGHLGAQHQAAIELGVLFLKSHANFTFISITQTYLLHN